MRFCILILFFFSACSDDNDFIQEVYVNEQIDLSLPEYSDLNSPGSAIFIDGGVKGLIIYHEIGEKYKVYDRNCSYEPQQSCSKIDSINSGLAFCGCCSSVFTIYNNGEPINSPALLPLKSYNYSLSGNILNIYN